MQRVYICLLCAVLLLTSIAPLPTHAAALLNGTDYVTSLDQNATSVTHSVSFRIPDIGGHSLLSSEYIRIVLNDYSALTPATSGEGWVGAPVYSVVGNTALITNVTAGPGDLIRIGGITATNPSSTDFSVTIELASDAVGTTVYDSTTIQPVLVSSSVTTSVSISYENSQVSLSGMTSPGALVTILFNNVIVGTTLAGSNGNFTRLVGPLFQNTLYDVEIYATDTDGRISDSISLDVTTIPHSTINLSNILLLPTIELIPVNVVQGEFVQVVGRAHPGSTIIIYLDDLSHTTVMAGSDGSWSYLYSTSGTSIGIHNFTVRELTVGAILSPFTNRRYFQVLSAPVTPPNPGGGTTTGGGGTGGSGSTTGGTTDGGTVQDTTPPIIDIVIPSDGGALSQDNNTVVIEIIEDNGIDLGSLIIIVGGVEYTIDDPALLISTEDGIIVIRIIVDTSFLVVGQSYLVEVSVDDLGGNHGSASSTFTYVTDGTTPSDGSTSQEDGGILIRIITSIGEVIGEFSDNFKVELAVVATALLILMSTLLLSNGWAYLWVLILLLFFPRSKKKGLITDSDGSPVPFMKILLIEAVSNKVLSKGLSDFNGRYSFDAVAGEYLLEFTDHLHLEKSITVVHPEEGELGVKVTVESKMDSGAFGSLMALRNKLLRQLPLILFLTFILAFFSLLGFIQ